MFLHYTFFYNLCFIEEFNYRNEKSRYKATRKSDGLKLRQLTGSGSTNSLEFVACQIFWHELSLPRYYAEFIFVVFILLISIFTFKFVGSNEIAYSIIGIYSAAAARLAPLVNNLTQ